MVWRYWPLAGLLVAAWFGSVALAETPPAGTEHRFTTQNFATESGVTLPEVTLVYGTYGTLNAKHDNVILVPSHYMADWHGYEWLIGKNLALDPAKYFIVATEMFGNGRTSSPSNTPEPFHGPRFPVTTIRDNVELVRLMLQRDFGVAHLRAIVGFSMGGQQAFQWAVSHPTFADKIVVTSATAKTYGHGIVRLEGQIAAIENDPAFKAGDYVEQPKNGLSTFGLMWAGWLFSQEWWRKEVWRTEAPPGTSFEKYVDQYRQDFVPGGDANDIILQMRAWEKNDVGGTAGFDGDVARALKSIKVPLLYMPSATDLYFPLEDAKYEAALIPTVTLKPIPSLWGHTAGAASNPQDGIFLNRTIGRFLSGAS